ncbi:MAG: response regulator [Alphaproteobacteria bacterium]|nr:response regulator [Alphaproteobacteria bacterium]
MLDPDVPAVVLDSLLLGFQVVSPEFRYLYVNEVVAAHGRTTRDALLGRTMMECYPGIDQTEVFTVLRGCLETREPASMLNAFRYPDGGEGWFELMFEPVPLGVAILSFDVTERHRAELALQRAVRARTVLSRCSEALVHADDAAAFGRELCRVLVDAGVCAGAWLEIGDEAGGGKVGVGTGEGDRPADLQLPLEHDHQPLGELQLWGEEGEVPDEDCRAVLRHVATSAAEGLHLLRERARRAQHAEQLAHAQRLETIGRLAGGVAHDFNNLLCVIMAHADFAAMHLPADGKAREELELLCQAVDRAEQLTRELLAFGRRGEHDPASLDVNVVVEGIVPMLRRLMGVDIEVDATLAADLGHVVVDRGQLEQVLLNLAVNARDAMAAGGRLRVETDNVVLDHDIVDGGGSVAAGTYVRISVSDTGSGMSPQVRRRIFEPFFTTKEPGRGTGLGLASAYGIIKQSGGEVWVYSEPGVGTVFRIYLPRTDAERSLPQPRTEALAARGDETILVVDDDEMVRNVGVRILQAAGFTVLSAADGPAAIALVQGLDTPPDLLLSDVVMPGMRGPEVAEALRALVPGLKVVFTSGYAALGASAAFRLPPDIPFVAKPFSASDLTRVVREALDAD